MKIQIQHFFDKATSTLTYVVHDPSTKDAVVIDPVWDYDPASGNLSTESMTPVLAYLRENELNPHFVMETHAHADHLSSSQLFKNFYPNIKVAIGENITMVQATFKEIFKLDRDFDVTGKAFDKLLKNGEILKAGTLEFKVIPTPGHTPACVSYLVQDVLFTGDAIFMPDSGTGRCDFPGGSAGDLYNSITQNIYSLPDNVRIFVGHDYQPNGRELRYQSTVGEEKKENIQLKGNTPQEDFIDFRTKRDATLKAPRLLKPSIRVNISAGRLPEKQTDELSFHPSATK